MESSFSGWLDSRHLLTRRIFLPVLSAQAQVNSQGTAESAGLAKKTEISITRAVRGPILHGCRGAVFPAGKANPSRGSGP